MDILRSKTNIALIVMVLLVAFIGGVNNITLQDNTSADSEISANA